MRAGIIEWIVTPQDNSRAADAPARHILFEHFIIIVVIPRVFGLAAAVFALRSRLFRSAGIALGILPAAAFEPK